MRGTVVGVLRGGASKAHEQSLASGHAVLMNLPVEHYTVRDIYIDRAGVWHERGLETTPGKILPGIDVAVIALHSKDGEIQKVLERFGIPHAGSGSFASFVATHSVLAREKAREAGFQVPKYRLIEREDDASVAVQDIIRTFAQPVVIRPAQGGVSIGMTVEAGYQPVHQAVTGLLQDGAAGVVVEEFVRGTSVGAAVVESLRDEQLYVLPATEVASLQNPNPGKLKKPVSKDIEAAAKRMHQELDLRHYSKSNFILSPRGIYYLSTDTFPDLGQESFLPASLAGVGMSYSDFLSHIIDLALKRGKR